MYFHFLNLPCFGRDYFLIFNLFQMKIFVAGLPYDLDDAELEEIFEKFGKIISAKVAIDRETGKSKGFGFVDMENRDEALEAISCLNDISLGKKPLVLKEAEERSSTPGGAPRKPFNKNAGGFNRSRNNYNDNNKNFNDRNRNYNDRNR